jgi:uncharacterized iron-regulated membrane protein
MPLRKLVFWLHLVAGLLVGVVVLIMSVTGVLLTYELQIIQWAERTSCEPSAGGRLPVATLVERLKEGEKADDAQASGQELSSLAFRNDPTAPVAAGFGRAKTVYLDPYTGRSLGEGSPQVREFFRSVMGWHRWLAQEGDQRTIGRHITGAANLAFLFLVGSGLYLWWPRSLRWGAFRQILWFRRGLASKARDWNWHHVIGFWTAVPLFVVVLSGVVISYAWAGQLMTWVTGGPAPQTAPSAPPPVLATAGPVPAASALAADPLAGIDEALEVAMGYSQGWRTISFAIPSDAAADVVFTIDHGTGRQPQKKSNLTVERMTGQVKTFEPFAARPLHQKARSFMRFGHTGEYFGVIGQTVAGLASAGAVVLVWTGFALAFRRLVLSPLRAWRRRGGSQLDDGGVDAEAAADPA